MNKARIQRGTKEGDTVNARCSEDGDPSGAGGRQEEIALSSPPSSTVVQG